MDRQELHDWIRSDPETDDESAALAASLGQTSATLQDKKKKPAWVYFRWRYAYIDLLVIAGFQLADALAPQMDW